MSIKHLNDAILENISGGISDKSVLSFLANGTDTNGDGIVTLYLPLPNGKEVDLPTPDGMRNAIDHVF